MDIILYLLELCSYFSIFSLVLRAKVATDKLLIIAPLFIGTIWLIHLIFIPFIFPDILIVFMVITLIYKEPLHLKICWFMICFLIENILSASILQSYCCFTNDNLSKTYIICFEKIDCIIFLCYILFSVIWHRKQKIYTQPFQHFGKKGYYLIIIVCTIDLVLINISSLLFFEDINTLGRRLLSFAVILIIFMSLALLIMFFILLRYHVALQQTDQLNQKSLQLEKSIIKTYRKKMKTCVRSATIITTISWHCKNLSKKKTGIPWKTILTLLLPSKNVRITFQPITLLVMQSLIIIMIQWMMPLISK